MELLGLRSARGWTGFVGDVGAQEVAEVRGAGSNTKQNKTGNKQYADAAEAILRIRNTECMNNEE